MEENETARREPHSRREVRTNGGIEDARKELIEKQRMHVGT
jgi:hypothetical protein